MGQSTWWEVMLSRGGGWSTAMKEAGILCVPVAGVKKKLAWCAIHLVMTPLLVVSFNYTVKKKLLL